MKILGAPIRGEGGGGAPLRGGAPLFAAMRPYSYKYAITFQCLVVAGGGIYFLFFPEALVLCWYLSPFAGQVTKSVTVMYISSRYNDNVRAQDAINVTLFHWGIHGWIVYVIIGLLLGFLCYRRGLPMTMRTIFYPILGDKIFGIIGDMIDTLCIVCTMFGVCTSLGLGVMQFNAGLHNVNKNIKEDTTAQLAIIWCITVLATISVISGIKLGIRRLSEICFGIGMLL